MPALTTMPLAQPIIPCIAVLTLAFAAVANEAQPLFLPGNDPKPEEQTWMPVENMSDDFDGDTLDRYEIRLSRFPQDTEKPMGASEARLKIGEIQQSKKLNAEDGSVTFELDLPQGSALLQTWLKDAATGRERGAYFITAQFLH